MTPYRVGVVVNPVAGLGGAVGLKGSDGAAVQAQALRRGAVPRAGARAALAVGELLSRLTASRVDLLAIAGELGADAVRLAQAVPARELELPRSGDGADTRAAVRALVEAGAQVVLFAGGDGTARDVLAVRPVVPVIGVPAGVKIHSAVYAVNPRAAGEVAAAFLTGRAGVRAAEVVDAGEEGSPRLYGELCVAALATRIQQRKVGGTVADPDSVAGIAAEIGALIAGGDLVVLGPGTTTRAVAAALGLDVPVAGVSAVDRGGVVAADVGADELRRLVRGRLAWIVVSPTGVQGFLLGRGNQQISPEVVRDVGPGRLLVVSSEAKLATLGGRPLLVDTGDEQLDYEISGFVRVLTGYGSTAMYRSAT
ncbi:ATP-NAD kinase family protein [Rhizohabitans arisaemae]|uniref:ATP-NAD kinase family protein n=1 Tax=Rhizohabitans arisaemae TaxID=2720610 RepID=UPI0024B19E2D|nr:NAD(+)/NADH kinase [Rhizohabitans arisaemae]